MGSFMEIPISVLKLEHLCFIKHVYQSTIVEMYIDGVIVERKGRLWRLQQGNVFLMCLF